MLRRPASGYRHYTSGALTSVGGTGVYWSSSPYAAGNANAGNLNFNSGNVNPLNSNARAYGFTVRCVQHLPEVVLFSGSLTKLTSDFFFDSMKKRLFDPGTAAACALRPPHAAGPEIASYSSQSAGKHLFAAFNPAIAI